MNKDYYQIVGLEKNASPDKIKEAYTIHRAKLNFKPFKNEEERKNADDVREAYSKLFESFYTKLNDSLKDLAVKISNLPAINDLGSSYIKKIEECITEIKSCINNFANADEEDLKNGYNTLREYHNNDDLDFNRTLLISIAPIKKAIIDFLEKEKIGSDYLRNVTRRHIGQLQAAEKFSDAGGHMSLRFEYLHECYEKVGKRIVELGYLLVSMEKIEEYC